MVTRLFPKPAFQLLQRDKESSPVHHHMFF
ncbi:hypothetical protein EDC14_101612 [Hydrogenispora ethanolica]|uniref:Uncharacterized protein n=1 Tax=Hydrogenispora ethanolica TaxID=1082276 RepID=A0A4R1RJL6_HYDET|nr:hypothetical protein EDC14_101612 [Hydrogenispora ethanolica]